MAIPFVAWLFQGIPECIAMTALVFSLGAKSLRWRLIIQVGIFQAIIIYLLRLLPLNTYFHVVIAVITLTVLCANYGKIDLVLSSILSMSAFLVLMVLEFSFLNIPVALEITSYEQFLTNVPLRILMGLPQVIVVFLLALLLSSPRCKGRIRLFRVRMQLLRAKNGTNKRDMVNYGEL